MPLTKKTCNPGSRNRSLSFSRAGVRQRFMSIARYISHDRIPVKGRPVEQCEKTIPPCCRRQGLPISHEPPPLPSSLFRLITLITSDVRRPFPVRSSSFELPCLHCQPPEAQQVEQVPEAPSKAVALSALLFVPTCPPCICSPVQRSPANPVLYVKAL